MDDPFSHIHFPVCSHSQTASLTWCEVVPEEETGSKLTVHEPFNKALLKHKGISPLTHSTGVDISF